MTEAQVEQIMGKYIKGTGWPASPVGEMTKPEELIPPNSVVYRHTNEGWGDSDWGVVTFEDNRVAQVEFLVAPKSTPPGADLAGGKLEQTGYVFLRWKEGLRIMIWHDIPESYIGGGSGSTADPIYRYHGHAESPDGRRFEVDVRTLDGKTAQFKIDNTIYDLSNGKLFLVTTTGGRAEVKQLQRDLSDVEPDRESIVAFAKSDPDVARFTGVTPDSRSGFSIYLLADEMPATELAPFDLEDLELQEEPILSTDDIIAYWNRTHEIELTAVAYERIQQLFTLPVRVRGMPFVVCVGLDRIYAGAFWTPASSLSFDGVIIMQPFRTDQHVIRIDLGYPTAEAFGGKDPRSDERILRSLETAGKLK